MTAAARTPDLSLAALARPFVLVAVFAFFAGFAAFWGTTPGGALLGTKTGRARRGPPPPGGVRPCRAAGRVEPGLRETYLNRTAVHLRGKSSQARAP